MNILYVFHKFCLSRSVDIGCGSSYPPAQVPPLSPTYYTEWFRANIH